MNTDKQSFQSNLAEKQYTLVRLEVLLDEMTNTLGQVKIDALNGTLSRSYPTLKQQYMNVLLRTSNLREDSKVDFMLKREDKCETICHKAEQYIKYLQTKGIYNLGREDFGI